MIILIIGFILAVVVSSNGENRTGYGVVDERIYGGSDAKLGQFPFQVHLQVRTRGGVFLCGGSLISDRWVLTAAHCTQGAQSIRIKMGVTNTASTGGQTFESSRHIEHPRYDSANVVNDIGLIQLPFKATLNSNVNIINLPSRSQAPVSTFQGKSALTSGWGRTSNRDLKSNRPLQFANVVVMNHSACRRYYSRFQVGSGEICTNNAVTRSGTCQGDSGGPLWVNENGKRVQIGITSWGVAQCENSAPSVYTNVAAYLGFINNWTGISVN